MKRFSFFIVVFAFFLISISAAHAGSTSYRINHGTSNQYYSLDNSMCATITNSHASNDYFVPAATNVEFNAFLTHLPAGITTSSCTASCPASGGCPLTAHNGTCTSYTASSVTSPSACSSVAVSSTCNNGSWSTAPATNASCTVTMRSCAASGACGVTAHGGTCSSNTTSSVAYGNSCPGNFTSTCSDGSWSPTPGAYASCSVGSPVACAASGACGVTAHGGTCSSNTTSSVAYGNTCPGNFTSTCSNGTWSPTPGSYGSCTVSGAVSCAASGACGVTAHNGSCVTYSSASVQDAACPSGVTSTCSNGTWSPLPQTNGSCAAYGWSVGSYGSCTGTCGTGSQTRTVVCKTGNGTGTTVADTFCNAASKPAVSQSCSTNICCGVGACGDTANGGSCTTYSSSAPSGAACSSVVRTSTCSGTTWSATPYGFSSCTNGCAASGACAGASNGSACSSYANGTVNYPSSCSAISSTCSNGSWSPSPGSSSGCSVNHSYSWGSWGTCSGGNLTRTCYDYGNAVSGSLCTAAIGGVESRSCSTTYTCASGTGPCATGNGTFATSGAAPAGEPFASCSGTVTPLCAGGSVSYSGSAAGCATSFSGYTPYTSYAYTSCMSGTLPTACGNGTAKSTSIMSCYGGYAWTTGSWGSCDSGCAQTRSVVCVNQADGSTVADSYCTGTKPSTSQSCTGGSCPAAQVVYGPVIQGIQNTTCAGYNSPVSSVTLPTGKTFVMCTYDYNSPYNNFTGGAPAPSYDSATGVCSMYLQCYGGVSGGACYNSYWCNQYVIRARLEYR